VIGPRPSGTRTASASSWSATAPISSPRVSGRSSGDDSLTVRVTRSS
jgi:hypothetical protein